MGPLTALCAAPAAAAAVGAAGRAVAAAATPFADMLRAATGRQSSSASSHDSSQGSSDADALRTRVANRLQQLLKSVGARAGDVVGLRVDRATGHVSVADGNPMAGAIESAIQNDTELTADLDALSKTATASQASNHELMVHVAESGDVATLSWQ